ncbi:hypothetical protein QBC45DRAFT_147473 [Copromyces sp. CBS 386.78]|nr:hypothetical protein QBC45DRAFT_147473 [Copromyces sp. CBS 386.78]
MNQPTDHPTKNPVERTLPHLLSKQSLKPLPPNTPFWFIHFMMYTHASFFHRFSSSLLFTYVNQNALLTGFVLMFPSLYTFLRLLCCAFPLIRDIGSGYRTLTRFYRPRSSEDMDAGVE